MSQSVYEKLIALQEKQIQTLEGRVKELEAENERLCEAGRKWRERAKNGGSPEPARKRKMAADEEEEDPAPKPRRAPKCRGCGELITAGRCPKLACKIAAEQRKKDKAAKIAALAAK